MTDPQWVAPGSGPPPDPAPSHPGDHAAYPPAPAAPPPGWHVATGAPLAAHPAMEFRPGIIPLRPLGLGDLYGAVVKAIRGNVAATMGLAFVTTLIFLVPTTALGAWIGSLETVDVESTEDVFPVAGVVSSYVPGTGTVLSTILLTGFVAYVIGQAVLGRRVSAGDTWEGTRGRLLHLVGATVVTSLVMIVSLAVVLAAPVLAVIAVVRSADHSGLLGAVLLAVAGALAAVALGLFLSTRLAFVPTAVVLERLGVGGGLARSWRLTRGRQFWRVLGIRVLTAVIVGVAAQVLSVPLGIIGAAGIIGSGDPNDIFVWQAVVSGLGGLVTGALTTPFTAGVDALLYVDQRIRREGFDVQLIATAQAATVQSWPGTTARS